MLVSETRLDLDYRPSSKATQEQVEATSQDYEVEKHYRPMYVDFANKVSK